MGNKKYRSEEWLTEQYYEKDRTIKDIAESLGVDHTTVSKWRRKLNVPKPSKQIEIECPVCSESFSRYKSEVERANHANVCSRECHYKARERGIIQRTVDGGYNTSETVYERTCEQCDSAFKTTAAEDYIFCSRDCFLSAHSERMRGKNNPAYIDGSSYDKRGNHGSDWKQQREKCYKRDNYECQRCGDKCVSRRDMNAQNSGKIIQAHHIEKEEGNQLQNLITLCATCHGEVEGGAELNV